MKKIILLLTILILSGCTATADIKINYDYSVSENIAITFDNALASNYDSPSKYAQSYLEYYSSAINLKNYNYEIKENNETSNVTFSKKTLGICDSIKYSLFSQYLYENIKCEETKEYIIIQSEGEQLISQPLKNKKFNVEKVLLTVKLPVSAEENNADIVEDRVYKWSYDESSSVNKNIYLRIRKDVLQSNKDLIEKQAKQEETVKKAMIVSIVLVAVGALLVISFTLYKKYKNNKLEY